MEDIKLTGFLTIQNDHYVLISPKDELILTPIDSIMAYHCKPCVNHEVEVLVSINEDNISSFKSITTKG
jgi:hypothetical protein